MRYSCVPFVGFIAVLIFGTAAATAQPALQFQQLPKEVRDLAAETRKSCEDENPDMSFNDMQGIQVLSLTADGARNIVVDNEGLCGAHMAGANCSNRGCDMAIYTKKHQKGNGDECLKSISTISS